MFGSEDVGERTLIERAQAGDRGALSLLLEEHHSDIARHARGRLPPAVRQRCADSDIVQETLLIAAQRIGNFEYRGTGSFRAWLAGIAENAARRAVQQHAGTQKRDVRAEASLERRPEAVHEQLGLPSPSNVVMGEETKRRVAEALGSMPEDYCTVIQLLQHRHLTLAQAAEIMDRSVNAVKKLHARALADLARRLDVDAGRRDG